MIQPSHLDPGDRDGRGAIRTAERLAPPRYDADAASLRESVPPSLRFPAARTRLYLHEIAEMLGTSRQHIRNLIDQGDLAALNLGRSGRARPTLMVPAEEWYRFVTDRNTARNPL